MKVKKYSGFQKAMIVIVPIVVLLLIAAVVMCFAMILLPMPGGFRFTTGNVTLVMALGSTALAVVGIIFAIFSRGGDDEEEDT
ncbi:MAG: hypothetical protein IIU14_01545 [Ruminococcus sp.]|nr:hypothetical protein [Ruminococcus sp.]